MDAKSIRGANADTTKKRRTAEMNMAVIAPGPCSSLDDMCSVVDVVECRRSAQHDDDVW